MMTPNNSMRPTRKKPRATDAERSASGGHHQMATSAELFDRITEMLCGYCDAPEVVIHVEMEFDRDPFGFSVVRHIRDPDNLFDNSRDSHLALPEDKLAAIRERVREYFEISKAKNRLLRTTLSVYQDGQWSVGSTSQDK